MQTASGDVAGSGESAAIPESACVPRYPIDGVAYRGPAEARRLFVEENWLNLSIGDSLRAAATEVPGKVAIKASSGATLTFAQLDAQSESIGASLLAMGLDPGDRVLFQVGTCPEFFLAFFGCMKAGLIPVCTLPQYRMAEMQHFAQISSARAILIQDDVNPRFDQTGFALELSEKSQTIGHVIVARGERQGAHSLSAMTRAVPVQIARSLVRAISPTALDVAVFQLSGGSTNLPKIIPRMHGEYLAAAHQLSLRYELTAADISLWSLPLIHNAGMLFVVLPVALEQRTLVLQAQFDVESMLNLVAAHGVTFSGSIGPIAAKLLEIQNTGQFDLSSLRQFFALNRAEALEEHLGIPVGQMFGMTEGMVFAAAPSSPREVRHMTVGYPVSPGDEVKLLVPGEDTEVPFGETGELCYRGPNAVAAYFGDVAATNESFTSDRFFRTGDLMRAHLVGTLICYSFEGRIKDNINRGGEKIGAEEIEHLIAQHPDVADVRVVAMPDEVYGEKACAYIIPQTGRVAPSVTVLGVFLLGLGIAKYKLPERIETIDTFPLTRVGKVDKGMLRELVRRLISQEVSERPPS